MRLLFVILSTFLLNSLLPAAEVASIPFELQKNTIFVKGSIAGSEPLELALDSGSGHTSLNEAVAKKLGMDLSFKALSSGAKGKEQISVVSNVKLRFGGVEIDEPRIVVYPLEFLSEKLGRRVDGIIGIELFKRYVVEIDYPGHMVRLHSPDNFVYRGPGEAMPVTFANDMPVVSGSLTTFGGKPVPARLQIDTGGARAGAMIWKSFVDQHKLFDSAHEVKDMPVTGFGGTTMQKHGTIQEMRIGNIRIDQPLIGTIDYLPNTLRYDGLLGSGFLKQFKVIFDLPHQRMIFERPPA